MKNPAFVIVAAKAGRLGNRLFQAAHFMGNALDQGYRLLNPSLGEYAPYFEGSCRDSWCGFPSPAMDLEPEIADQCRSVFFSGIHVLGVAGSTGFLPAITTIDIRKYDESADGDVNLEGAEFGSLLVRGGVILPMGWKFSSHAAMSRHRDAIIRYFTPVKDVRLPAENCIDSARLRGDLLVGVHLRQEDYRRWKNGIHFYETEHYVRWMREVRDHQPDRRVVFVVCASNPFDERLLEGLTWMPGPGDPMQDLHALSLCDRIMGPPSTFSGWAAYRGGVRRCVLEDLSSSVDEDRFV